MPISKIYIDQQVRHSPVVISIQSRIPEASVSIIQRSQEVYQSVLASDNPIEKGKTILYLTRNKGAFIKECPGTRSYTCCGYQILHMGTFCTMDCSYCILQTYFHPPILQYFVNYDDLMKELDRVFLKKSIIRIGTGEFTDSLIWDHWTDISRLLVTRFSEQSMAALELKTKTSAVKSLKVHLHNHKTIVSWSLNTPRVIKSEERGTASLSARLRAASNCELWGYPLGFHFDPLIIYDGCETTFCPCIFRKYRMDQPRHFSLYT